MKDTESKVTPLIAATELKMRQSKVMHSCEDIHVGPNTKLSGGFTTNGMIIVDGGVDAGDLAADRLVVSHIGALEGKAVVCRAEISGVFSGELVASDEVIVRSTAKLTGNVQCQRLVIHRGARIECAFSCWPEAGQDVQGGPGDAAVEGFLQNKKRAKLIEDRKMFLTGAGSVLALMGSMGLIVALKMLLS